MKSVDGVCRFCGQFMVLEVPESYTQEMTDEEATKKCKCPEAKAYTRMEENIANAEGAIRQIFKDRTELETVRDILFNAVRPMAEESIGKISISKGADTCSMKPTKDGIRISIKRTTEDAIEA